ncbi:MAG: hypothetical protein J6V06_07310 [Clostridia bacterium]|nr:hypothetical protein [Clostridia bacterium]
MKKLLAIILALAALLSFAACGKEDPIETPDNTSPDAVTTEAPTEAKTPEKAIVEGDSGVGPVVLSNSYLSFEIPEGFGYYIDDANQQEGDSQFQVIVDLKNADGNNIGELLINNRGALESADEYANSTIDEYKDNASVTVGEVDSATYGIFDTRHFTLDKGFMVDNRYFGYYQIPDENVEFRNVRFELELLGYYYKDVEFPKAECEAIMNSIVIK